MNLSFKQILTALQFAAPYALLVLMFALDNIYLPWAGHSDIRPSFTIMAIYYWMIYRPALLPPLLIFFLSLAMDVTNGTALGLHCLILLPIGLFVRAQRRFLFEQPFFVVWLGFLAMAAAVNIAIWALVRISAYGFDLSFDQAVMMALLYDIAAAIFLFPVVAFILYFIHKMLPQKSSRAGDMR
jgi:rod shape-determining protein MreD